jgi:hypothetical protein
VRLRLWSEAPVRKRDLLLVALVAMTTVEARTVAEAAIVRASRIDSALFTACFFGYENARFQEEWHEAWNKEASRVVQWSPIEHGKTQQVTGWALHKIGRDPINTRILWIGGAQTAALKSTGIIKGSIENPSPYLRSVFPALVPGNGKWTQAQFTVKGAKITEKDCTVETAGAQSQILGGRFTDVILDDICNHETTYTASQRRKVSQWIFSTVLGRVLDGGRVICIGNAWYPDDVMHALKQRGFEVIHNEAYRETPEGRLIPDSILWKEQWSVDRLGSTPMSRRKDGSLSKRMELGTVEALRQLRCVAYSAGQGRFKLEWFDKAMEMGADLTFVDEYSGPDPVFMGVDLGVSQKEGSDATAFWAMAVNEKSGKRRLLNTDEERLDGPDIIEKLKDWNQRYAPVTMVENNASQEFIRQFAGKEGIPTRPFTTGKQKADPAFGVPSLGVELEQGLWILPSGDERSRSAAIRWRTQCLAYTPGEHTGDTLMASWFAREAARAGDLSAVTGNEGDEQATRANYGRLRARYGRA